LVARVVRDDEVAGSNPVTPTIFAARQRRRKEMERWPVLQPVAPARHRRNPVFSSSAVFLAEFAEDRFGEGRSCREPKGERWLRSG
jgi:hypothetical protein